jgi:IS30 family transposase
MTVDNGRKFSSHKEIASKLDVDVYFAHTYHTRERFRQQYP